ncbi:hypothetical protein DY000_02010029 [Brassica cretica]|uniref:Uncharacterized protein n=1 Tax=Brassica cretica TaxID=69181 RepID=A0ABQ7C9Y4_BRACR|nr:hypothetical protein DY000_02010029 [Brassica cretica]
MWSMKKEDLTLKERLSKIKLLEALIARQGTLADYEEDLKKRFINESRVKIREQDSRNMKCLFQVTDNEACGLCSELFCKLVQRLYHGFCKVVYHGFKACIRDFVS